MFWILVEVVVTIAAAAVAAGVVVVAAVAAGAVAVAVAVGVAVVVLMSGVQQLPRGQARTGPPVCSSLERSSGCCEENTAVATWLYWFQALLEHSYERHARKVIPRSQSGFHTQEGGL